MIISNTIQNSLSCNLRLKQFSELWVLKRGGDALQLLFYQPGINSGLKRSIILPKIFLVSVFETASPTELTCNF